MLTSKKAEISSFFQAYKKAVIAINENPENYRDVFMEKGRIPPFLAASYPIPTYPEPAPFSKSLFMPVIKWLEDKKLAEPVSYEQMVATDFMADTN